MKQIVKFVSRLGTVLVLAFAPGACDEGGSGQIAVGTLERDRIELASEAFEPVVEILVKEGKQTVHIDYLSYSQIQTFTICPLHYKLKYIYKIPTPPTSAQSFGNTFHQTMKAFYEVAKEGKRHRCRVFRQLKAKADG